MLVISELFPKMQSLQAGRQKASTAGATSDFLRNVTLVDVLPPVPPLHPRKFLVCICYPHIFLMLTSARSGPTPQ